MAIEKISFKKVETLAGKVFTTEIILKFGINIKMEEVREINQVNTANTIVDAAAEDFEERKISVQEMIEVLRSEGYSQYIS